MTTADATRGAGDTTPGAPNPRATDGADATTGPERAEFWARSQRGWDVAFYAMVAVGALALVVRPTAPPEQGVALGAMAALVVAYTVFGRRAGRTGSQGAALTYLCLLVVLVSVVVYSNSAGTLLLPIAYSQIWYFSVSRRQGAAFSTVLTVGVFGALAVREQVSTPAGYGDLAAQAGIALGFALILGLWVTQVAERGEERAQLLADLEAAQAEIGRSHHAAGVAAERERMAGEIHDTLAQGFTSIVMLSQTAVADLRRDDPGRAAERMALIERTARDNLAEARALVAAFAPVGLDGSTLGEALERLAVRFEQETGVRIEVDLPDEGVARSIGRDREVILLRAAQEALANVRRHAQARHVQLVLGGQPSPGSPVGSVHLEVVDDGRGIDDAAAEGFGLRGMRDRVTSGGGELAVSGRVGGGTRVRVTLPVQDAVGPTPAEQAGPGPVRAAEEEAP